MLKQRIITAVILAICLTSVILLLESKWVSVLLGLFLFLGFRELISLTITKSPFVQVLLSTILIAGYSMVVVLYTVDHSAQLIVANVLWLAVFVLLYFYQPAESRHYSLRLSNAVITSVFLWVCVFSMLLIHQKLGGWMLMYLLTLVWVADIGAYFAGRRFGKNKLAPTISPGKTWEGVAGGVALNLLWVSLVYWLSAGWGLSFGLFLGISLLTAFLSVFGDLYESLLKREAGVKDSGILLPGHGGVLDRIDSLLLAAPVFTSGLMLAGSL